MASIRELHEQIISKERSAVEITQEALNRIQELEPKLHSFLTVTTEQALKQAQAVDAKIAAGEEIGILAGIPIGIKDNLCTKGIVTTCASRILENFVPPYESTVTQKLADAGGVMVGKTNLDEFAMGLIIYSFNRCVAHIRKWVPICDFTRYPTEIMMSRL